MVLHLARRQQRLPLNPYLIRFSSNSSSDSPPQVVNASGEKPSLSPSSPSDFSYSSAFADIKTNIKQKLQNQQDQGRKPFEISDAQAQNRGSIRFSDIQSRGSIQDLGINLAKFQRRSNVQPSRSSGGAMPSQSRSHISFEALYKQNAVPNSADPRNRKAQDFNWNSDVWEKLKNLKTQTNNSNTFKTISMENVSSNVFQGTEPLPMFVFGKEMDERKGREDETEFLTFYSEEELGEKLRMLRPEEKKEEGWFSLQELNQRLVKLRQVEEKEAQTRVGNYALRNAIGTFKNDTARNEAISQQNEIMGHLGGIPKWKLYPPNDDLVETYFHPDNMSSAEKMKVELTKVREEFKMSESDCGSARVQVAQLTTKIKHLSSVLHKKDKPSQDKHSRKGLVEMVQKRKKLLKYLRRTDWDSYSLVLSKLSLRDKPEDKYKNYGKQTQ